MPRSWPWIFFYPAILTSCATSLRQLEAREERCEVAAMRKGLSEDRSSVRELSARGLGRCGVIEARPELLARALDPKERRWVRAAAARALGDLNEVSADERASASVHEALLRLAASPRIEPEIRLAALDALAASSSPGCDAIRPLVYDDELLVSARAQSILSEQCPPGGRS
ncbi:MAG: HEAT repeat domain-containing protein [Myxococcota bacterium]